MKKIILFVIALLVSVVVAVSAPLSSWKKAKGFIGATNDGNALHVHYFLPGQSAYQGLYLYRVFTYYQDLEKGELLMQFKVMAFRSSTKYILEQTCPRGGHSWIGISALELYPGGPAPGDNDEITLTRLAKRVRLRINKKLTPPKYTSFTGLAGCAVFSSFQGDSVRIGFVSDGGKFVSCYLPIQEAN
jgi:hypothetical protein